MDVFFTNETALEFWRLHRRSAESRTYSPSQRRPPCEASASYTVRLGETWGLPLPLDIMVDERSARRPTKAVRPHVCSKPVPDGSFASFGDSLYLSSPEFCFFQMAAKYPLDNVARQIAVRIGKKLRYKEPEFLKARRELRSVLF